MPFCCILGVDFITDNDLVLDFSQLSCFMNSNVLRFNPPSLFTDSALALDNCGDLQVGDWLQFPVHLVIGGEEGHVVFGMDDHSNLEDSQLTGLVDLDETVKLQNRDHTLSRLRHQLEVDQSEIWPPILSRFRRYRNSLLVRGGGSCL